MLLTQSTYKSLSVLFISCFFLRKRQHPCSERMKERNTHTNTQYLNLESCNKINKHIIKNIARLHLKKIKLLNFYWFSTWAMPMQGHYLEGFKLIISTPIFILVWYFLPFSHCWSSFFVHTLIQACLGN